MKIFSSEGVPIDNANIRVCGPDLFNEYIINVDALGYYQVQINNVQFYPDYVCKLNVNLINAQSKNQTLKLNQKINLPLYENVQISQSDSELPQDEVREMTLSLGTESPKDTLIYLYAQKFAEEVNALSNGKIKINIYTDSKLGIDRQMLETIKQDGNIDFIAMNTAHQVDIMPKLSIFDIPMVYTNIEDLRKAIYNDEFYKKISNIYLSGGYKLLGIADELFRVITTNKEMQNIDDFTGIKVRIVQNHNIEAFWKALGATVIPLPIGEIYSSLKNGFIDSAVNPYENIAALKLYELQKYVVNTNHMPYLVTLITSEKFYNSLSADEKAIFEEAAVNATTYARGISDERFEELKKTLTDNGMTIVDIPYETKQAMRLKAMPIYEMIREIVGDDDLINSYFGNVPS